MLNDDDAPESLKKTLPGASASFMQVAVSSHPFHVLQIPNGLLQVQHHASHDLVVLVVQPMSVRILVVGLAPAL